MKHIRLSVLENQHLTLPFVIVEGEEDALTVDISLEGVGATFQLLAMYIGKGKHSLSFTVRIVHRAPHTTSRTHIRSVLFDTTEFINDGLVQIQKGAKYANTFYTSRVLLFDHAKGKSIPSLEIDENDITGAGHASSLGRPRDEELLYLQSRGLSKRQSERLLVRGFFEPILQEVGEQDRGVVSKKLDDILGAEDAL